MGRKPEGFKPPSQSRGSRRRDTVPAALQYSSTTQADSRGLLGSHEDNELEPNPFSLFGLGAKVAHRHHYNVFIIKELQEARGSIPRPLRGSLPAVWTRPARPPPSTASDSLVGLAEHR